MDNIASVVISNSTRKYDKKFHYLIPDTIKDKVKPGVRVIVPFGRTDKSVEACVFCIEQSDCINGLKQIKLVIDNKPVLNKDLLELSAWMKDRYVCTFYDAIKCMLPPGIGMKSTRIIKLVKQEETEDKKHKKILDVLNGYDCECEYEELKSRLKINGLPKALKELEDAGIISICEEYSARVKQKTVRAAYLAMPKEEIIEEIDSGRIKKIHHIRVLEMLLDNEYISVNDIARFSFISAGVLDTLKKYGYIDFKDIEINRDPLKHKDIFRTEPLNPTLQQNVVLQDIKERMHKNGYDEILLHGVTGSGKTEVYLQLIQRCLEMGRQAIVLVPEISLTPQMVERFKGRFGESVAVLHSRLSLGERYDQWRLIRDGKIKVAVGARSAVFAPFENLGAIIIDEEHENTYKSEVTPKYNARDVAGERCRNSNALLLYGSATPSMETYYSAKNGKIGFAGMNERANNLLMPKIEIVDMRNELNDGNRSVFSKRLAEEIGKNIRLGQQTMLFLNRRGYSTFVLCRNCGYTLKCANCNVSLTYHSHDERLICHYCGYTIKNPDNCPRCKSGHIRFFGTGTQKIEDDIKKQFPGCSVIRMDMDTTNYKNSHEDILKSFREKNINIMIGTQMIAKGHDFPNVTLVGVLAADSLLNTGDYRASERTFQLITQVAGRAGRGELPGRVVVQTYNTEDFSILAACEHDYISFYNQEIKIREKLDYPPFTNIASVILSGTNDRLTFNISKAIKDRIVELLSDSGDSVNILGPTRSPLSKIKNRYRWRIVIKCKEIGKLIHMSGIISDEFYEMKERGNVELSVDINPVNML